MKKETQRILIYAGMVLAVLIIIYGVCHLVDTKWQYEEAAKEYDKLQASVVDANVTVPEKDENVSDEKINPPIIVDMDELKNQNLDTIGWIYYPVLGINYPIMQDDDNKYYMTHTYQGEKNAAGSIFIDMNASVDFSDDNSLVYGHNMKNGTMFGSLKNIRNTEIVKNNPYIWVFIDNTAFRYQIFSWHDAKVTDKSFQTIFDTLEEKQEYLDYIEKIAEYKLDVPIDEEDKIITLSTCTSDSSVRFLVHGVLADEVSE